MSFAALKEKINTLKSQENEASLTLENLISSLAETKKETDSLHLEVQDLRRKEMQLQQYASTQAHRLNNTLEQIEKHAGKVEENNNKSKTYDNEPIDDEDSLLNQLKQCKEDSEEAVRNFEMTNQKLMFTQMNIKRLNESYAIKQEKVDKLKKELATINNDVGTAFSSNSKTDEQEDKYENEISALKEQLQKMISKADESERAAEQVIRSVQSSQRELDMWKAKTDKIKKDMEGLFSDMENLNV